MRTFHARDADGSSVGTLQFKPYSPAVPLVLRDQHGSIWVLRGYASEQADEHGNLAYYLRSECPSATLTVTL